MSDESLNFPLIVFSIIIGIVFVFIYWIAGLIRSTNEKDAQQTSDQQKESKEEKSEKPSSKKRVASSGRWNKENKKSFTHPWLLTSLKGHSGRVLDMDFSQNGKYLASSAEDGDAETRSESSSVSDGVDRKKRRNRKHRKKEPQEKKPVEPVRRGSYQLKQYQKLNMYDADLYTCLRRYILTGETILKYSYPFEMEQYPGKALIINNSPPINNGDERKCTNLDVNAQEFVPSFLKNGGVKENNCSDFITNNRFICLNNGFSYGHHGSPLKEINNGYVFNNGYHNKVNDIKVWLPFYKDVLRTHYPNAQNNHKRKLKKIRPETGPKTCCRCQKQFTLNFLGEYESEEECIYHWGKLKKNDPSERLMHYECCKGSSEAKGCYTARRHVWNGLHKGVNGPLDGYVKTRPLKSRPKYNNYGAYALDCEMGFTSRGFEVMKVSLVGLNGKCVYEALVQPETQIVDYNTKFSGITARTMKNASKTLRDVQNDLLDIVNADTILVGHGLENDLRVLKLIHYTVIDTSVVFPHYKGYPFRSSLKALVQKILKRPIQGNSSGHCSLEDSRASMDLILWRLRSDLATGS